MAFVKCPTCLEWGGSRHRCEPTFLVWCDEQGETEDDALVIYALSAEEAAEKWADRDDFASAEYQIVAQKWEPTVTVKDLRGGEIKRFVVTGEAVPSYHATEVA